MFQLNVQPKIVGRDAELNILQSYLNKTSEGQGNVLFISGEVGVGKTRLVNEIKQIAQDSDFQILTANSIYESQTPYMPFMEALKSGGLESLLSEETPRVEAVYLLTHAGLLIKEIVREETVLNPDIFASMITSVGNFVKESLSKLSGEEKEGALNALGYEDYRILIETRQTTNLVVILTGKENEFLINDMKEILSKALKKYGNVLVDWDGDEKNVEGIEAILQPLTSSGKYDGIYYGKEDPKARRNLLFENVTMGLIRQAQKTPILLYIEDIHCADPSTLALIHYVARNARKSGLLILGTFHPEELAVADEKGHPLINTMQLMDREDLIKKIELERLPRESIDEFLGSLLGKNNFSDEFINRIYNETEGNPLFIIQLMKFLVEENILLTINCIWELTLSLEEINIPPKVYNVIERRLNRVEKEYRKLLDYASVIGETFSSKILAFALNMEKVQVLEQLRKIEHRHRLVHPQNVNYKFDHAKIKEVLYEEIPIDLRIKYHLTIAHSIEELNKDNLDEIVGELAFHYYNCRDKEKALIYLRKAAEKAKKEYSNEEAIKFFTQSLEFEEDENKKSKILEEVGDIYKLMGDYEKVKT
jgi:predicted ATPase